MPDRKDRTPDNQPPSEPLRPEDEWTRPSRRIEHPDRTRISRDPAERPARPTRVTPQQPTPPGPTAPRPQTPARRPTAVRRQPPASPPTRRAVRPRRQVSLRQRLVRALTVLVLLALLAGVLTLSLGVSLYFWYASQLPPAEELLTRRLQFATTRITDREGNLLWEIIDPTGGRRTVVPLSRISPHLVNATIATEDRFFFLNVGVDPIAIARAVYYNVSEHRIVSGASTITQQLARNVLLSPEERTEQTLSRKIKEAVLAVEINRRYTKEQILEIYLNQIYYGNLAYGIEAAAQTYFGKSAADLTLPEAALLAGLPQSPAVYDPYTNPDGAKQRQATVLDLMVEAGYITPAQAQAAKQTELQFREQAAAFAAPHFVAFVRQELEKIVPPEYIYQAGLRVQTTLDPRLQAIAEEEVRKHVDALAARHVTNGALVALDVSTGEVLALVGSKDFRDEAIDGQVNMATSPRQPGSTIKPLTYLAAFERLNYTPSTLIMDTPVEYPDGAGGVYKPENYDRKYHGPVSLRVALANSYNIPAVKTLERVGIDALKEMAARLGITTLTRSDYGLSLALGSGEVPLIEMTGAYQAMANSGVLVPPTAILKITDSFGREITPPRPQPRQVLRPEHAYLITHILADNEARAISFGPNSPLRLSRPAAAKTGTTNEFRDNWTIGYTPDIVAGVWVGNADNSPMQDVSGLTGAAPIWHNFMERAHEGRPVRDFVRPPGIIELEVCADSGTIPSQVCPKRRKEIFFKDQPPLGPEHDIHQLIKIDRNSGLRANEFCQSNVEERYYQVYPPDGREWAIEHGIEQPPDEFCPASNIFARITSPPDGSTVRGILRLEGAATAANFSHYQVELGVGVGPQAFVQILGPVGQIVEQGVLGQFDTTQVDNGPYTLRLV
ncbi:MAG: penicillin-binding protein 1C, partial [Chloroflexi bacterium]